MPAWWRNEKGYVEGPALSALAWPHSCRLGWGWGARDAEGQQAHKRGKSNKEQGRSKTFSLKCGVRLAESTRSPGIQGLVPHLSRGEE